jgi:hypothetical protein
MCVKLVCQNVFKARLDKTSVFNKMMVYVIKFIILQAKMF